MVSSLLVFRMCGLTLLCAAVVALQMEAALRDPTVAAEIAKAIALDAPVATGMIRPKDGIDGSEGKAADAFDTVIAGPWMGRWDIVHHNRHGMCVIIVTVVVTVSAQCSGGVPSITWQLVPALVLSGPLCDACARF